MSDISVNTATLPASAHVATNPIVRDSGKIEHMQIMNLGDPITANSASVSASGVYAPILESNAVAIYDQLQTGIWSYMAGDLGTINVPSNSRVIGITCYSILGGSLSINGGQSFPIIAGSAIAIQPFGNIIAPIISFVGTNSYFVELVT